MLQHQDDIIFLQIFRIGQNLRNYAVTGKGKFFQLSVVFAEHGPKKKILSYVPDSESLGINFLLQRVYLWHFEDHLLQVSERIILFYFHFRHKRGVVWEPVLREKQREVLVFLLDKKFRVSQHNQFPVPELLAADLQVFLCDSLSWLLEPVRRVHVVLARVNLKLLAGLLLQIRERSLDVDQQLGFGILEFRLQVLGCALELQLNLTRLWHGALFN